MLGHSEIDGVRQVVAVSLETGERTLLFEGTTPRYVSSGYVVFLREDVLWAARFDPEGLIAGPPTRIIESVPADIIGFGQFAVGGDLLFHGRLADLGHRMPTRVGPGRRRENGWSISAGVNLAVGTVGGG